MRLSGDATIEKAIVEEDDGVAAATAKDLVVLVTDLPVNGAQEATTGPLAGALSGVEKHRNVVWVGLVGRRGDHGQADTSAPAGWSFHAVSSPGETVVGALDGFVEQTLWPLYHDLVGRVTFEESWWEAYRSLNQGFATQAASVAPPGAQVWVHDIALQLVPDLLRRQRPDLSIGVFLPAPFPPVDTFRRLPWRRQIINHLLQGELVGFQDADSARNFTNCATLFAKLSGARGAQLELGDHRCRVEVHPMGISASAVQHLAEEPATVNAAKELRRELGNPNTVLASLATNYQNGGADLALRAVHRAFSSGEPDPAKTVLVVVRPSPAQDRAGEAHRNTVNELVDRLSADFGRLGRPLVHTADGPLARPAMVALYRAADLLLVTPRRDGISLEALAYVASRVDNGGGLILSEFTGTARLLESADIVNPFDVAELGFAIVRALRRSTADRARRMTQLRRVVHRADQDRWLAEFLRSLARVSRG